MPAPSPARSLLHAAAAVLLMTLAALLAACADPAATDPLDAEAERVWEQFLREEPKTKATFELALRENGFAAKRHGNTGDRDGVRYQVRGIEAQSIYAAQESDTELALMVANRIDELDEADFLTNFEQVFPGARARLDAARERVAPLAD